MILVDTAAALGMLVAALARVEGIGVDTEADSFYRYRERTCLVQISTRDEDYLVDPLALADLSALRPAFSDPRLLKVFHAADNDVAALKRDLGLVTHHLFDTMLASRILGVPRFGLADLLREHFAVETDKRLQRYDWGERPLARAALAYGALDSRYLLPLSELLGARLREQGRAEEAAEEFQRLEGSEASPRRFDPDAFWRIKGGFDLAPSQRAVLRELYIWRDRQAEASNRPPFRIAGDQHLLALAQASPTTLADLDRVASLPPLLKQRQGARLLTAIRRGLAAPPPVEPRSQRPDLRLVERYEALRHWRRRVAAERGVEPDVIVSNAVLSALAQQPPSALPALEERGLLGPWKLRAYGEAMLAVLRALP